MLTYERKGNEFRFYRDGKLFFIQSGVFDPDEHERFIRDVGILGFTFEPHKDVEDAVSAAYGDSQIRPW